MQRIHSWQSECSGSVWWRWQLGWHHAGVWNWPWWQERATYSNNMCESIGGQEHSENHLSKKDRNVRGVPLQIFASPVNEYMVVLAFRVVRRKIAHAHIIITITSLLCRSDFYRANPSSYIMLSVCMCLTTSPIWSRFFCISSAFPVHNW